MLRGLLFWLWAQVVLGESYTSTLRHAEDQPIVTHARYKLLRHTGYSVLKPDFRRSTTGKRAINLQWASPLLSGFADAVSEPHGVRPLRLQRLFELTGRG